LTPDDVLVDSAPEHTDAYSRGLAALNRLRADYARRYGTALFELTVQSRPDGAFVLVGEVLLGAQRDEALAAVQTALDARVEDGVVVLVERDGGPWYLPAPGGTRIHASPNGDLATELVVGDPPVRRLTEQNDWWLVEAADATIGWTLPQSLRPAPDAPRSVAAWRAAYRGRYRDPAEGWAAAVAPWLGAPYLWGGATMEGVDCSAFIQRVMKAAAGVGLPKHSADQVRAGERVARDDLAPGDLIYLVGRESAVRHVALVLEVSPLTAVVHASRALGVTIEPLDALLERYRFKAAARFRSF
jgi:cell wall-associated NlpC family hydrolase